MSSIRKSRFCVLGVPVDEFDMDDVISAIDTSARQRTPMLISTINANFLANSQKSQAFRHSLISSDLCTVDGIGMMIMCRLLSSGHMPRVSGADMLDRLLRRQASRLGRPLRLFFLGGIGRVAEQARHKVNMAPSTAICCVGALNPGFGSLDELSRPDVIKTINDANPDFLVVALGAERGQAWLMKNRRQLKVPVCAHLGAALNFTAGTIERAPVHWQALGLEWLWRIRQEASLLPRYWRDGRILAGLLLTNVLPMALMQFYDRLWLRIKPDPLTVSYKQGEDFTVITLAGSAVGDAGAILQDHFAAALNAGHPVRLDCNRLRTIDTRGIGEVMRLRRDLESAGTRLVIDKASWGVVLRLNLDSVRWML